MAVNRDSNVSLEQLFNPTFKKILKELELYIKIKSNMKIAYYQLWQKKQDSMFLIGIQEQKSILEQGQWLKEFKDNISVTTAQIIHYDWNLSIKRMVNLLMLEINILEYIFKGRRAALTQDHITAMMCINNAT